MSPFRTAGTAIVLYPSKSTVHARTGFNIAQADSHKDHFVLGLLDLLVTWRAGFLVNFPKSVCLVTDA